MALGRAGSSSSRIPRAMAPEVTTTTSTPARWRLANYSHTRAMTARRSSPLSSVMTEEPSLTTTEGTRGSLEGRARVELEHDAADLDVVAGLESRVLKDGEHSHAAQPVLHVSERLLVLEV